MADVRLIDVNAAIIDLRQQIVALFGEAKKEVKPEDYYITKLSAYHEDLERLQIDNFIAYLNSRPTINPDDFIPCGRWINAYVEGVHYYRCSECGEYIEAVWTANFIFKNCPNCGACMNLSDTDVGDMDGKENENDRHRSNRHRRGGYPDSGNHLLSGGSRRGREDGQEMSELKPCPFCGSAPRMHNESWPIDREGNKAKTFWVRCGKCGSCSDEYPTAEATANAWNRRATDE